jgi:hypothetical protein
MKANELRIGNYINEYNVGVLQARILDFEYILNGDINYQSIELTEEWLLKLGFVKNNFDSHYEKGEFYIEVWEKDFVFRWNDFNIDINLNSVHRLQNLYFALTLNELL